MKEEDEKDGCVDEWVYVAMIIDRINLWVYTGICLLGSFYFFSKVEVVNHGPKNDNIRDWFPNPGACGDE